MKIFAFHKLNTNIILALFAISFLLFHVQLITSQQQNLPFPNSFGPAGLGSAPNEMGTPVNDGTIPSFGATSSDSNNPIQQSQPGYQQQ